MVLSSFIKSCKRLCAFHLYLPRWHPFAFPWLSLHLPLLLAFLPLLPFLFPAVTFCCWLLGFERGDVHVIWILCRLGGSHRPLSDLCTDAVDDACDLLGLGVRSVQPLVQHRVCFLVRKAWRPNVICTSPVIVNFSPSPLFASSLRLTAYQLNNDGLASAMSNALFLPRLGPSFSSVCSELLSRSLVLINLTMSWIFASIKSSAKYTCACSGRVRPCMHIVCTEVICHLPCHSCFFILRELQNKNCSPQAPTGKFPIKNEKGEVITSRKGIANVFGEFCSKLYDEMKQRWNPTRMRLKMMKKR